MIYANKVINNILLISYLFFSFLYRFFTLHLYCNCNGAVTLN